MKTKIMALAVVGIMLYACSPKTAPAPTEAKKELSPALAEGRTLYENNCAKCHKLYNTSDYTAEQWSPILERMKKKAKIDDATTAKIYAYVTAN